MKKIENVIYLMMVFPLAFFYSFVISSGQFFYTFCDSMNDYFKNFKEH